MDVEFEIKINPFRQLLLVTLGSCEKWVRLNTLNVTVKPCHKNLILNSRALFTLNPLFMRRGQEIKTGGLDSPDYRFEITDNLVQVWTQNWKTRAHIVSREFHTLKSNYMNIFKNIIA